MCDTECPMCLTHNSFITRLDRLTHDVTDNQGTNVADLHRCMMCDTECPMCLTHNSFITRLDRLTHDVTDNQWTKGADLQQMHDLTA